MTLRRQPDGGRYTRPRRGFRTKSHYRERLRKRGLKSADIRMEPLSVLRRKQGDLSGSSDSAGSQRSIDPAVRGTDAGLQVPRRMFEMALDYETEEWEEDKSLESYRHRKRL